MSNITKGVNLESDFWTYIENIRSIVLSEEEGWVVGRSISTYYTYLGIQDDTQNIRLPGKTTGLWAGSMIKS